MIYNDNNVDESHNYYVELNQLNTKYDLQYDFLLILVERSKLGSPNSCWLAPLRSSNWRGPKGSLIEFCFFI